MIKVGTKNDKGNRKYAGKGSLHGRKLGIVRTNSVILLVFVICISITATMPVSAMVAADTDILPTTDQSATCPCKSQSNTQPVSSAVQSPVVDASVLNQLVQSSYSPSNTAQQTIGYTPQYSTTTVPSNGANVNTIAPSSVQNNAGPTEATGMAPTADFSNLFSQWINNEMGSNIPGYSLGNPMNNQMFGINPVYTTNNQMAGITPVYTTSDQMFGINPMFTGWQMSPVNIVQTPMQLDWLNQLMWY